MSKQRLTFTLDEELHANFKTYVAFKKTNMSKVLCELLKKRMEEEKNFTKMLNKKRKKK